MILDIHFARIFALELGSLVEEIFFNQSFLDYFVNRMHKNPALVQLAAFYKESFSALDKIPHFLRPCYFELLFSYFYAAIEEVLLRKIL